MTTSAHRDDVQGLRALAILLVVLSHAGVGFLQGGFVGVDVFFVLSGFLITGLLLRGGAEGGHISLVDFYLRRGRRILPAAALTLVATDVVASNLLNLVRAKEVMIDSAWAALFGANIHFAAQGTDYFARGQPPSPLQHFWSLSVEEQFYLVWPVLLTLAVFGLPGVRGRFTGASGAAAARLTRAAFSRLGIAVALIALASLGWSVYITQTTPEAAFFSTAGRAWELALGAALAVGGPRLRGLPDPIRSVSGWIGLTCIGIAGVVFSTSTPIPGYAALLPTMGAALVIAAGLGEQRTRWEVGRVLSLAPLRYIGDRSYAFYLWHWPVLVIAVEYEGHELSVLMKLLLLAGAFLLSIVSYKFFEDPIRRGVPLGARARALVQRKFEPYGSLRRRDVARSASSRGGLLLWPASVLAVLLVASIALASIDNKEAQLAAAGEPATPGLAPQSQTSQVAPTVTQPTAVSTVAGQSLPAVVAAVSAARKRAAIPAGLTPPVGELLNVNNPDVEYVFPSGCAPASDSQTTSQVCRLGNPAGVKSLVVFGDSHAQMWMPTIVSMARLDGWVVRPIVKSGCSPYTWLDRFGSPACRTWYKWAVQQVVALRPQVTLVSGAYGGSVGTIADAVRHGLFNLTAAIKRSSKRVVLVADDDGISRQPVDCLLAGGATMATCTSTRTPDQLQLNDGLASSAKYQGFGFLATRGWFCYDSQCPMVVGHTVVYRDLGHITASYALALVAPFRTEFRQAAGLPAP